MLRMLRSRCRCASLVHRSQTPILPRSSLLQNPRSLPLSLTNGANDEALMRCPTTNDRRWASNAKGARNTPLLNEKLVEKIMALKGSPPAETIELRLVVEESVHERPNTEVTSLSDAIATAIEKELDLVEINIDQDVPVIRAVKYEAKLYRDQKKKRKDQAKRDPSSVVKEFRFKAGTAEHDLQRKVKIVKETLQKGHRCKIQARCPRYYLAEDPRGAATVLDAVLDQVGSYGEQVKAPEMTRENTAAIVILTPSKKSVAKSDNSD